jgi:AraC-like DNA-binding protein
MQRLVLSTDDVPEGDRFSYFREAIDEKLIGITSERRKDQEETPFHARIDGAMGPSLVRIRYHADGRPVFRRSRDIARIGWDEYIWLYREASVGAWFDHDRREFLTQPGDLIIADPTIPFATDARADYDLDLWFFPRKLFDPHVTASQRPRCRVLTGGDGLDGMVKAYLDAFARQLDVLDDQEAGALADNFCRLLAVACGANAGEQREAARLARLAEAKRYVDLHLADPELTAEKAAGALKMSMRSLHLLFEPSEASFAQYVLRRRLEECRAALAKPIGGRSVTDIALGWGFNSLPTFYRTFRKTFGATPGELRDRSNPLA